MKSDKIITAICVAIGAIVGLSIIALIVFWNFIPVSIRIWGIVALAPAGGIVLGVWVLSIIKYIRRDYDL